MKFSFRVLLFSILFVISLSGISHAQSQGPNWYTTGAASAPFMRLSPDFVITEDVVNKCRDVVPPAVRDKLNSSGGTDGSDKEKECHWILGVDPSLIPLKLSSNPPHTLIQRKDGSLIPQTVRKLCIDDNYHFTPTGEIKNQDCQGIGLRDNMLENRNDEKFKDPDFFKGEWWIRETMNDPPTFLEQHAASTGKRFGEPGFVIDESVVAHCKKCFEGVCDSLDYDEDGLDSKHIHVIEGAKCKWIAGGGGRINYQGDGSIAKPSLPFTLVSRVVQRPNTKPDSRGVFRFGGYISHEISELCKDDTLMPNSQKRKSPTFKSDCDLIANPPDLGPLPKADPVAAARRAKELAQQNVTTSQTELETAKAARLAAEQKLADAKTALEQAEKDLEKAKADKDAELQVAEKAVEDAKQLLADAEAALGSVNSKLQELEQQLANAKTEVTKTQTTKQGAERALFVAENKVRRIKGQAELPVVGGSYMGQPRLPVVGGSYMGQPGLPVVGGSYQGPPQ
jgi:hypothetical protein